MQYGGSASHISYLMINDPSQPHQLTHAKCMKSGSWSWETSPLELAILLLFVMSFIILISLSHALTSRPSFFSRTLAVAIRVSKFSRPRTYPTTYITFKCVQHYADLQFASNERGMH